jgi:hypothetical protein
LEKRWAGLLAQRKADLLAVHLEFLLVHLTADYWEKSLVGKWAYQMVDPLDLQMIARLVQLKAGL